MGNRTLLIWYLQPPKGQHTKMALSREIIKNIYGFSIAKYSTWFYYKPDHILFDAGEGVSVSMRNMIYGIDSIFLSHGHGDHIGGLPGLLRSRASSMGDKVKPIKIYYPRGNRNIIKLQKYIQDSVGKLPFEIFWNELSDGETIPLSGNRKIQAFATRHIGYTLTLGYRIIEERMKLQSCYKKLPKEQLIHLIKTQGKESISEKYGKTLLCFSGDSMPLEKEIIKGSEVLLHDATFACKADREEPTHATIEEVFELTENSGISTLCLFHLSARYKYHEINKTIQKNIQKFNTKIPVFSLFPHVSPVSFKEIQTTSIQKIKKEINDT